MPRRGKRINVGAYDRPFSGVGIEFEPLGAPAPSMGFVLHEVGYWPCCRDWNFPNTFSPFWRIIYSLKPGHHVRFGEVLTPLGPERLLVIPGYQRFDCLGDPPVPTLWLHFSCQRAVDPREPMPISIAVGATIRALADELADIAGSRRADRRERTYSLGQAFCTYVLQRPEITWREPIPDELATLTATIAREPARSWTTATLAELVGMSPDGFSRWFRRWLAVTPSQHVRQARIREACRGLAETEESIERIAHQVGFKNRHHFSRVFREITGTTPKQYRQTHAPDGPT
jgi:AraC-like DNA-binding protein